MMILLAILQVLLLASMSFDKWNGLSPEVQQKLALRIGEEYLKREPDCAEARITIVREDEDVLFDAECAEVRKTNL